MKIKIDPGATIPTRAHKTDAGLDLYSRETKVIWPLEIDYEVENVIQRGVTLRLPGGASFDTGVHIELPHGYFGKIESKSGLNVKNGVVSCGGVIDEGYTGSIVVKLYNFGASPYTVHKGDKIAKLVIMPYLAPELELVSSLDETDRGNNGFGSTGK